MVGARFLVREFTDKKGGVAVRIIHMEGTE